MIKFIYFDIGGVLLLDFSGTNNWYEMKRDLGFTDESIPLFDQLWDEYVTRVNLDYDIDNFVQVLNDKTDIQLPKNYSMLLDFISRFEINSYLAEAISLLVEKYKLGLLTNMYPRMLAKINENNLIPQLKWDVVIDSSAVGFQKPDDEVYDFAEEKAQVKASEILFVDNLEENLIIPRKRGWNTFLYNPIYPDASTKELAQQIGINY